MDESIITEEQPQEVQTPEPLFELFDFEKAKVRLNARISEWESGLVAKAALNRKERYVDLDIEALRKMGTLSQMKPSYQTE
jgi:hypothetical protein